MVGARLYRMDKRAASSAELRRSLSAARARRARLLRPTRNDHARRAGRARSLVRRPRLLLLLLLVRRAAPAAAPAGRSTAERSARLPVLRMLGQRELDAALGRR